VSVKDKARELAVYLHAVREQLHEVDKYNPETSGILSTQETYALVSLGLKNPMIMSELATALRLSLSSVTALVDKLERKKYIKRTRSQDDRRVVRVALTPEGRKFYALVEQARHKLALSILMTLDQDEQDALLRLSRKMTQKFRQQGGDK
jgi:DNA-binding MarR family transcriptional regulator